MVEEYSKNVGVKLVDTAQLAERGGLAMTTYHCSILKPDSRRLIYEAG